MSVLADIHNQTPDLYIQCFDSESKIPSIVYTHVCDCAKNSIDSPRRNLVITSRALRLSNGKAVWGFACPSMHTAFVSVYGLGTNNLSHRIANVIAHEFGHLDGLEHCSTNSCVMKPAANFETLDSRGFTRCGRCPKRTTTMDTLIAITGILIFMAAVHLIFN